MFVIGSGGLRPVKPIQLQAGARYYMGASDSPDRIVVLKVDEKFVTYQHSHAKRAQRDDVRIIGDLVRTGCETWLRRHWGEQVARHWREVYNRDPPAWMREEAQHMRDALDGKPLKVEDLTDWDRVCTTVRAADGTKPDDFPRGDAWYGAEGYGGVGGRTVDGVSLYKIHGSGADLKRLRSDARFVIVEEKVEVKFGQL